MGARCKPDMQVPSVLIQKTVGLPNLEPQHVTTQSNSDLGKAKINITLPNKKTWTIQTPSVHS